MNEKDVDLLPELLPELLDDLRVLAADGPVAAPGHIEERLRMEFRRQKRCRKLVTWTPWLGAAAAASIALLVWVRSESPKLAPAPAVAVHAVAPVAEEETDGFYPLPEAEALPAVDNAMVVRVQLPVSSLQLMGVPVNEDSADLSVQADLLLGQDGLARAVRLVE
jgi:hypothetical protein